LITEEVAMHREGETVVEPAGLDVTPRKIDLAISPDTPRYWFDGHPFKTHYFNALSSTFPVGERFFVRSVRHYLDDIDSDSLKQKVNNFVSQEGRHSIEHDAHIKLLLEQGYQGIRQFERVDKTILDFLNRYFPRFALAATISLEHFTAILANELLEYPERWISPMHEDMRLLWQWHAIEETEHKAVAFDVYQAVCGSYGLRVTAMVVETVGLLLDVLIRAGYLLWKDGLFWKPRIWWQGIVFVWGKNGALRSILKDYFRFYRRDFHPWKDNNYHLVKEFLEAHHADFK
jgi:predicted metal-dependent hydrolase